MSKLFRKSVIERMSSPEQLDRMVVITSPAFWIAIIGGAVMVLVAVLWALFGGIPEKVDATGVYVSDSGTYVVSSETNDIVKKVNVESGETVSKGDVLYTLKTEHVSDFKGDRKSAYVKAPVSGTVSGINIADGSAVAKGTVAMVIHKEGGSGEGKCTCYVSITDAQKIKQGMEVNVYPSCYDSQVYGHILGKVASVNTACSTEMEVFEKTGDSALAQSVLSEGPVIAVTCELIPDKNTVSGYKWSTDKSKRLEITEGTYVSAEVISEKRKPITMFIPYLQKKLEGSDKTGDAKSSSDAEGTAGINALSDMISANVTKSAAGIKDLSDMISANVTKSAAGIKDLSGVEGSR